MILIHKHIILVISLFASNFIFAQIKVTDLHYRNDTLPAVFDYDSKQKYNHFHTSVKPYIIETKIDSVKTLSINKNYKNKSNLQLYPLSNISTGFDNINHLTYTAGLGLGIDFSSKKFYSTAKFLPFYTKSNYITDSITFFSSVYPSASQKLSQNTYFNSEFIMAFKANKFFTFLGGYGKNFFGDGYRSLLLSDNAPASPFLKIETSFASVKYVNLYQVWRDIYQPLDQLKAPKLKYSATHYLSWNITNDFNLSIFESVVIGGKDTLSNRGFDLNYLNPVVFYRPVEYSSGSADNVLIGLNMSYKPLKNSLIYYQLILDEFYLKELRAHSKWWANKFGMQIGFKAKNFLIDDLYFQTEFNFVRPYTYSHKFSAQNYGQLNAPVAHPIGASFYEIINIISYKKGKHQLTNKMVYSGYGIDTSTVNYGQNIFHSYADRAGEYDQKIMQGLKTNVFNNQLIYEYAIAPKVNLYLTAQYTYRFEINQYGFKNNHYIMVGLKSRIWNKYTDF